MTNINLLDFWEICEMPLYEKGTLRKIDVDYVLLNQKARVKKFYFDVKRNKMIVEIDYKYAE